MRKLILLVTVFSISFVSYAQFTVDQSPYFSTDVIHPNHAIINKARLTIQGGWFGSETHYTRSIFSANIYWDYSNNLWKNTSSSLYRDFEMMRFENGGRIGFFASRALMSSKPTSLTDDQMENYRIMTLTSAGKKVGIGTSNPDEKLTVKGAIHCEEVKVDLNVPADYVFEKYYTGESELNKDYVMPTLEEVESYTKENNHLPSIPSAQEIKENGLHLKEMTNLLLQKIEELTLYTIEQEKRIKALEAKLETTK